MAELLGVGVEAVDEVVHDELQLLLLRGRDVHLVPCLAQPLVRVEDLERLGCVSGEDQDAGHVMPLCMSVRVCASTLDLGATPNKPPFRTVVGRFERRRPLPPDGGTRG